MAIITAAGLCDTTIDSTLFNKNGSTLTLKKISETDWLVFGDLAPGSSQGFSTGGGEACWINPEWQPVAGVGDATGFSVRLTDNPVSTSETEDWSGQPYGNKVIYFAYSTDSEESFGQIASQLPEYIQSLAIMADNEVGTLYFYIRMQEAFPYGGILCNLFVSKPGSVFDGVQTNISYTETTEVALPLSNADIEDNQTLCVEIFRLAPV